MLLSRRSFERREPDRDAKCIYIFCEGIREYDYFRFFDKLSEKIKVVAYPIDSEAEDNTPSGLYAIACNCLKPSEENPNPRFELSEDVDEVWIVFDTDVDRDLSREPKIEKTIENCEMENRPFAKNVWNVAESNPCFEVWLYYHFEKLMPNFDAMEISKNWKSFVDVISKSGFDSRKHPQLIGDAIKNAEINYHATDGRPAVASTQVFLLGKTIYPLIEKRFKPF